MNNDKKYQSAKAHADILSGLLAEPKKDINWYHAVADTVKEINRLLPFVEAITD